MEIIIRITLDRNSPRCSAMVIFATDDIVIQGNIDNVFLKYKIVGVSGYIYYRIPVFYIR